MTKDQEPPECVAAGGRPGASPAKAGWLSRKVCRTPFVEPRTDTVSPGFGCMRKQHPCCLHGRAGCPSGSGAGGVATALLRSQTFISRTACLIHYGIGASVHRRIRGCAGAEHALAAGTEQGQRRQPALHGRQPRPRQQRQRPQQPEAALAIMQYAGCLIRGKTWFAGLVSDPGAGSSLKMLPLRIVPCKPPALIWVYLGLSQRHVLGTIECRKSPGHRMGRVLRWPLNAGN